SFMPMLFVIILAESCAADLLIWTAANGMAKINAHRQIKNPRAITDSLLPSDQAPCPVPDHKQGGKPGDEHACQRPPPVNVKDVKRPCQEKDRNAEHKWR